MAKKKEQRTKEFKLEAVRLVEARGDRSVTEVADDLGVRPNQLYVWRKQLRHELTAKRNDRGESMEQENRRLRKENEQLKIERTILKKAGGLLREGNRVEIYRFIHAEKAEFEVSTLCRVLTVKPSAYYAWAKQPQSASERSDLKLTGTVKEIFETSKERYGAPRVHLELSARGVNVSRKRIARLMKEAGLAAKSRKKFKHTTDSAHDNPISPNLLEQQFEVAEPNEVWTGDITYLWTQEGWLYLAVVIDLFSRRVVGWALSERMTASLVCNAFDMATALRVPPPGLIFHSDRGSQYASAAFRSMLQPYEVVQSMSRKGNCWDNAVTESFFASLKKELASDVPYPTRVSAKADVFEYIEVFYNRKRIHTFLGNLSPSTFESCIAQKLAA
ncbi:MAG: IS3 family transposase [Polyangiaceae bacterium]|nr:IS3 family transposase [Polyangiaceae bacterium]